MYNVLSIYGLVLGKPSCCSPLLTGQAGLAACVEVLLLTLSHSMLLVDSCWYNYKNTLP